MGRYKNSVLNDTAGSEMTVPGVSLLLDFLCVTWSNSLQFKLMNGGFLLPATINLSHFICSWTGTEIVRMGSV